MSNIPDKFDPIAAASIDELIGELDRRCESMLIAYVGQGDKPNSKGCALLCSAKTLPFALVGLCDALNDLARAEVGRITGPLIAAAAADEDRDDDDDEPGTDDWKKGKKKDK